MTTRRSFLTALLAALAALAAPTTARGDVEPNDARDSANGPIASDVPYTGALGRDDGADTYVLFADAMRTITITAQSLGGLEYFDGVCFELLDGAARPLVRVCPDRGQPPASVTATLRRGRHDLRVVSGDDYTVAEGATYAFTVSAPGGLTTGACLDAEDAVLRFRRELDAAQARLRRAARRLAQRRTRETIRDLRFALDAATQRQALDCAP